MRTLSIEQKEKLAQHIAKKPIEYIELYNELYDHYATTYETGQSSFEETLGRLDEHFNYKRVKRINDNLLKKIKKSVNEIYWKEFKNFWRWPKILSTLGIKILGIVLIESLPVKSLIWVIIIPIVFFNLGLLVYGPALSYFNKIGRKKFKSAHLNATQYYLNLPISVFNLCILLPIIGLDSTTSRILFFESYPIVLFLLIFLLIWSAFIGFKVFRTKIKVQYL